MVLKKIFRAVVICFMFLIPACKCVDKGEIASWKWAGFPVAGICPVNKFPVPVNPTLDHPAELAAIRSLNKSFSVPVLVIDKKNGIPILVATSKHPKYKEHCEPLKLGDGRGAQEFGHIFSWTEFRGSPGKWDIKIYICLEKFNKGIKLMQTPIAQRAKEIGLYGYIKHELGHLLIGPGHPRAYAELMSKSQRINALHYHTKTLIEETVIKQCKAK